MNAREIAVAEPSARHRRPARLHHLAGRGLTEASVARSCRTLAEQRAAAIAQARAAVAAAPVDAEKKLACHATRPVVPADL
jgi:hypothetical protein